jgi:hypothetical protein
MFLPLLGERAGVRGNRTPAVLAVSASDSAPDDRPKGHIALRHSSFQASALPEVADKPETFPSIEQQFSF